MLSGKMSEWDLSARAELHADNSSTNRKRSEFNIGKVTKESADLKRPKI